MFKFFNNLSREEKLKILDSTGSFLIGAFCLGYLLFIRRFAELHISFSFLNFPVFVGEVLLVICLILLIVKWKLNPPGFRIWHYYLFLYLLFVLIKAFWGYFKFGPLAFRHAALFYYPLFAVFGYSFYRREFFSGTRSLLLALLLIVAMRFPSFGGYYLLMSFIIAFVLIKAYIHKTGQYIFFLLLLFFTPYRDFFQTSRAMLVANMAVAIYFLITLFWIVKIRRTYKLIIFLVFFLFLSVGILKKIEDKTVKPLLDFRQLIESYDNYSKVIAERKNGSEWLNIIKTVTKDTQVKLYNPEGDKFKKRGPTAQSVEQARLPTEEMQASLKELQSQIESIQLAIEQELKARAQPKRRVPPVIEKEQLKVKTQSKRDEAESKEPKPDLTEQPIEQVRLPREEMQIELKELQSQIEKIQKEEFLKKKSLVARSTKQFSPSSRVTNVFFRIFIWKDMLSQLKQHMPKSLLGFHFGKPFRSESIEYLYWATGEWSRDGWIAVHNSYLGIIYRAGILGILFIAAIFISLFRMIKRSIKLKSVTGVLLCGILINWLVAANFLPILELPYNAIPIWSLFGMTLAYLNKPKIR